MRRPFVVTAIGGFLVGWNAFVMIGSLPQHLYYNNISLAEAVVVRVVSFWSVFIVLGLAMIGRRNWARIGYLFIAPIQLTGNLILGTARLGVANIVDRIPSLVVTLLFMSILLRPNVKAWFLGTSMAVPPSEGKTRHMVLAPTSIVSIVSAGLIALLWMANQFIRVAGAGDERSKGIIEYYLSR